MLNSQTLHELLQQPRFAFITHADRSELVGAILNIVPDADKVARLNDEAGEAQDTVASLCASILDIAEHAGLVVGPVENMADVLEALKDYVMEHETPKVTEMNACMACNGSGVDIVSRNPDDPNATTTDCPVCGGTGITPKDASTPADPTPAPTDPAPAP